jgi:hypothetical protein
MQKLKKLAYTEDDGMSTKWAMDAGISKQALLSLDRVQLFGFCMFVALTHQRCVLCHKPFKGEVSEIGSYLHKACRSGQLSPSAR